MSAQQIKKPPLGLVPRNIAEDRYAVQRLDEVRHAIDRYLLDGETPIPLEWVEEYNNLVTRLGGSS